MKTLTPRPVYALAIAWALLFPLLFFVARGTFSFDRFQYFNNQLGDIGAITPSGADTAYYRVERFIVYGIVLAAIFTIFKKSRKVLQRHWAVMVLPLLASASTIWSQDKPRTLFFAILALCLTGFGVYLLQRFDGDRILELFIFVGVNATLISYMLVIFAPSIGIRQFDMTRAWQGMFVHKNVLAGNSIYLLTAVLYTQKRSPLRRILMWSYSAALFILIAMSQSRTGWLTLILLFMYYCFSRLYLSSGAKDRLFGISFTVVAAAAILYLGVVFGGDIAVALGKTRDMTGRTRIWSSILPELFKRPFLGFGYQAFWLEGRGESLSFDLSSGLTRLGNAENAVFQIWLELGAVGTVCMLALYLQSLRNAFICLKLDPPRYVQWSCAIVFLATLGLLTGAKVMFPNTIEWVLFVIAYITLADRARRVTTRVGPALNYGAKVRCASDCKRQSSIETDGLAM